MVHKIDREDFVEAYSQVEGKHSLFNALIKSWGYTSMSERTFQRRKKEWIGKPNPVFERRTIRTVDGVEVSKEEFTNAMDSTFGKGIVQEIMDEYKPIAGGIIESPTRRRLTSTGRRFVFTSAQNNTYVHENFFNNLLVFCNDRDAQLVVGQFRYNKSGFQNLTSEGDDELWFDPKIKPYVIRESMEIENAKGKPVWCGELDILPTAENPLSGLDNYTRTATAIIPHVKVQMKSVPVMPGNPYKFLFTTGAVTQRNYIQRKTGQKAEFHHVFGALYLEIDDFGNPFFRQLVADTEGNFYDLTDNYRDGTILRNCTVAAINWGDIHAERGDEHVTNASWKANGTSMLDVLKPEYQFIHDLTDFRARNHHNIKDPFFLAEMYYNNTDSVQGDMRKSARALSEMYRQTSKIVVVESNHDLALRRWLVEADIRKDPANALFFHEASLNIHLNIIQHKPFKIFEWAVRKAAAEMCLNLGDVKFLDENDSFLICGDENGIECGLHGHRGPNGARGNPNSFKALGRRCNTGHTHTAGIVDGVYTAGHSCLADMGYNKGPTSWSQSHIVTYSNGKRTIVTIVDGKWRA